MKPILVELTPEEAHNLLVLVDMALKSADGGIKIVKVSMGLIDKVQAAVVEAQKDSPAAS